MFQTSPPTCNLLIARDYKLAPHIANASTLWLLQPYAVQKSITKYEIWRNEKWNGLHLHSYNAGSLQSREYAAQTREYAFEGGGMQQQGLSRGMQHPGLLQGFSIQPAFSFALSLSLSCTLSTSCIKYHFITFPLNCAIRSLLILVLSSQPCHYTVPSENTLFFLRGLLTVLFY